MMQFKGFETLEEAKEFKKKNGRGFIVWDEKTPKRKGLGLTVRGSEYDMCVIYGGLDKNKYPYAVTWRA